LDHRNQMVDVLVSFHTLVRRNANRPRTADLADVVAQQIDDHRQLGLVLLAALELFTEPPVFLGGRAAGTRALDGSRFHEAALEPDETFRRGRYHLMIAGVDVGEERGG